MANAQCFVPSKFSKIFVEATLGKSMIVILLLLTVPTKREPT